MSDAMIHDQMGKNGFVWFHGVVEDINDPLKMGRVRVRCFEFHNGDKQLLPTSDLPWATLLQPVTSAAVSGKGTSPTGLLTGSWVIGFFRDGVNCQDPVILGSFAGFPDPIEGTTGEYSDPKLGFNDPEGKWPSKNYGGEPDTNRLARNEKIERTIVQKKKDETLAGIQTALHPWLTWDEKPTEYAAEYPKNHVIETESGHVIELDDTPNKERIGVYHKAGTWIEVHPDGSKVQKTRGDDYEIALSDKKLLVKGNCYMNMDGAITTLKAGRDFYIEIGGDVLIEVNVIKSITTDFPVTETADSWITHGVAVEDIQEAMKLACEEAAGLLVEHWGFTYEDAFIFLSVACDLGIAQNVHPCEGTVIAKVRVPKISACPKPFKI
jgi:hypothetical protein